ncbi:MAG: PAS domain S-box protein [Deltaproteobacteria bacterium]|nr:PAS domain S-box protein [Deltaproteobacteria bacterium]
MKKEPTSEELKERVRELEKELAMRRKVEDELRFSEERFTSFMDLMPAAVFIKDSEGRYVYVNCFYEDVLGVKGLIGKTSDQVFPETVARSMLLDDKRVLAGELTIREEKMEDAKGEERIFQTHKFLMDRQNGLRLIGGFALDVTEHKRAEEALRASEEKYRIHFNNISDVLFSLDRELKVLNVSPSVEKLLGYRPDELIGKAYHELNILAPEYLESAASNIMRVMAGVTIDSAVYEFITKDGERKFGELSGSPLRRNGKIVGMVSVARDITGQKRAEDTLHASEERYRTIVENSHDGIVIIDDNFRLEYANDEICRMTGYGKEELVGADFRKFLDEESVRYTVERYLKRQRGEEVPPRYEINFVRKNGEEIRVEASISIVSTEMGERKTIAQLLDITERKRAEEEKKKLESQLLHAQKMEAVGTLAGGVAHDFNNLLQAILGYTQMLLLNKGQNNLEYSRLKQIEKSTQRASELTRQLLTFSRKVESELRPLDLNNEVRQVQKILERTIPKMIDIELHLQEDVWTINADSMQMEQIVMNLAVNARDAMAEGGKLVFGTENVVLDREYCAAHLGAKPGRYVLLSISDTGMGMDRETVEHIFEPFYTTKEMGKGTGLGLAMVYGIVKSHGGYIMCYSERGEGTTFKIYLPVIEAESKLERQDTVERVLPGGDETILLVDDEESLRGMGKEILEKFAYMVFTVPDGETAVKTYREKGMQIDLVILDLVMPGMGGKQCLEELLRLDHSLKVIIASGYAVNGRTKEALDAGAEGFIRKPYELTQMLGVVRTVLDRERTSAERGKR